MGYRFADASLLARALTHVSALAPGPAQRRVKSYQRLEFLGDRVLGLAVLGHAVRGNFPTPRRASCRAAWPIWCARKPAPTSRATGAWATWCGSAKAKPRPAARRRRAILGDVCESHPRRGFPRRRLSGGARGRAALLPRQDAQSACGRCATPRRPCRNGRRRAACRRRPIASRAASGRITRRFSSWKSASTAMRPPSREGSSKRFAEQASAQKFLVRERVWEDGE